MNIYCYRGVKACPQSDTVASAQMMLVMELVGGGNLGKALSLDRAQPRRLGWHRNGRFVLLGIARGLAFIHSRNVRQSSACGSLCAHTMDNTVLLGKANSHWLC